MRRRLELESARSAAELLHVGTTQAARQHAALRGFLLHLNAEESPFSTFGCKVWNDSPDSGVERSIFASRVDLLLSQDSDGMDQEQYEEFARRPSSTVSKIKLWITSRLL